LIGGSTTIIATLNELDNFVFWTSVYFHSTTTIKIGDALIRSTRSTATGISGGTMNNVTRVTGINVIANIGWFSGGLNYLVFTVLYFIRFTMNKAGVDIVGGGTFQVVACLNGILHHTHAVFVTSIEVVQVGFGVVVVHIIHVQVVGGT